ncbi:MAG: YafY family protein [bacterium]|nr:YafY family protein [bacterium]
MKIDRLLGILVILLQRDKVTAPELAERFEVSRRTINRDIEDLCMAGIPICAKQGVNGGISIMEGYKIDSTILTTRDMQGILAGLRSLDSVNGDSYYSKLMEKLQPGSSDYVSGRESILIDLSSWHKDTLAPKIELIQTAIEERHLITFTYYSPRGEEARSIEAYYLIFKWASWYVWGWCRSRQDYRMFKLNRMERLSVSTESYERRDVVMPELADDKLYPGVIKVKALFTQEMQWRLIEDFGLDCYKKQEDGRLLFTADYSDQESFLYWLLTFGDQAELLEPCELRLKMEQIIHNMSCIYDGKNGGKKNGKTTEQS